MMLRGKLTAIILLTFVLLLSLLAFLQKDAIYIAYIKLFKKTALVKHYNKNNKADGEVIGFIKGKVYGTNNYVDGTKEGLETIYYENGNIKSQIFLKHGKRAGKGMGFYKDGALNYSVFWKNDKEYGSAYHYSTSKKLTNYDGFDIVGLFCYIKYDTNGKIAKLMGHCFSGSLFSNAINADSVIELTDHKSYININDLNVTVATPPNLEPQIIITINNKRLTDFKIIDNTITTKDVFVNKGTYNIEIIGHLIDEQKNVIKADTLEMLIQKI